MANKGYFLFSLDTELGLGYFDLDKERHALFSADGHQERDRIRKVLELCQKYGIHGTWAIVGHLFFQQCEYCEVCLLKRWQGKFKSFEEAYGTNHPLWYGPDLVLMIRNIATEQEIGFHGYTHETFDTMSAEQAQLEIKEWKRLAERFGIQANSVIFPRERIGKLVLLHQSGFDNYRYDIQPSLRYRKFFLWRYLKTLDHIIGLTTAPSFPVTPIYDDGMLRLTASQHLFAFNRKVDMILDRLGLTTLRIRRIIRGIKKAAKKGCMFHLWAHPWEFATAGDVEKLEAILSTVAELVSSGEMVSVTMGEMADIIEGKA